MRRANTTERDRHSFNSAAHQILANATNSRENKKPKQDFQFEMLLQELQEKDLTILSLKRNYEAISRTFHEERTEAGTWQQLLQDAGLEREKAEDCFKKAEARVTQLEAELAKSHEENRKVLKTLDELRGVARSNRQLSNQLDTAKQNLHEQTQVLQEVFSENKKLKTKVQEYEEFKGNCLERDTFHTQKVDELTEELTILKEEMQKVKTELDEKTVTVQRLCHEKGVLIETEKISSVAVNKLRTLLSEEREELCSTRHKLSKVYTEWQTVQSTLTNQEGLLKLSSLSGKDFELKIQQLEDALVESHEQLILSNQKHSKLTELLTDSHEETKTVTANLDTAREEINTLKAEMSNQLILFTESRTDMEKQIQQYKSQLLELHSELLDFKQEKNQLIASHHTELIETQQNSLKNAKEVDKLKSFSESLQKKNQSLLAQLKEAEATICSLETTTFANKHHISDLTEKLSIAELALTQAQQTFAVEKQRLEAALAKEKEEHKKVDLVVESLNDWQTDKNQIFTQLNQELLILKQENQLLKERLGSQKRETLSQSSMQDKLTRAEATITQLRETIFAKDQQLSLKNNELSKLTKLKGDEALLDRISQLRDGLEHFGSADRLAKVIKSLDKLRNGVLSLARNMSCHSCFNPLEAAKLSLPCTHILCSKCERPNLCGQCHAPTSQSVSLQLFPEITGKLTYTTQVLEEVYSCLSNK